MKLFQSTSKSQSQLYLYHIPHRSFGPKPPAQAAPTVIKPEITPPLQRLIDSGKEFIMGPPAGANKTSGAHRSVVIPKIANRIDIYAKKLREYYFREGIVQDQKTYLEALRLRQPEDSLEKLMAV